MKLFAITLALALGASTVHAQVWVNPYQRQNGTWVQGYERTRPDNNPYNNYNSPGNYNPNTGRVTPYGSTYGDSVPQPRGYTLGR